MASDQFFDDLSGQASIVITINYWSWVPGPATLINFLLTAAYGWDMIMKHKVWFPSSVNQVVRVVSPT